MKKTKTKAKTWTEVFQSERKTWDINPVTKVIPDKRYKKPKYKNNYDD